MQACEQLQHRFRQGFECHELSSAVHSISLANKRANGHTRSDCHNASNNHRYQAQTNSSKSVDRPEKVIDEHTNRYGDNAKRAEYSRITLCGPGDAGAMSGQCFRSRICSKTS
jgi:hypothetical protein